MLRKVRSSPDVEACDGRYIYLSPETHKNIHNFYCWLLFVDKYKVVTDNPWLYVWIADAIIFAIYAYAWDVRQDFDLWDCSAQVNSKFLRDELIYESKVMITFLAHFTKKMSCCPNFLTVCQSVFPSVRSNFFFRLSCLRMLSDLDYH